jgi:HPt (histidine-containing phosphotransfer) domain-containing protein
MIPKLRLTNDDPGIAAAIDAHFEGDAALYRAFANSCLAQFAIDSATGQAASDSADMPRLGRLAHDLKSVLLILGYRELSDLAAQVEAQSMNGDLAAAALNWTALRTRLPTPPS